MELHYGRVTSKGQITIPVAIRKRLELETGTSVLFLVKTDGRVEFSSPAQDIRATFGTLPLPPGMTGTDLAAMADEIGTTEAVERYRRAMGGDDEHVSIVEHDAAALAR